MQVDYRSALGRTFLMRPLTIQDTVVVAEFFMKLSSRTLWLRYMTPLPALTTEIAWQKAIKLTDKPTTLIMAFAALIRQEVVAIAEVWDIQEASRVAEIAVVVRDEFQHEGIGTEICRQLLETARQSGYREIQATFLYENIPVRGLLKKLGLAYTIHTSYGQCQFSAHFVG